MFRIYELFNMLEAVEEAVLYLGIACVVFLTIWWVKQSPENWRRARWPLVLTLGATVFVLLFPHRLEVGEDVERFNVNPFHGLSQILLLDTNTLDPWFSQAWALGNLVLLWPVAAVLIGWGWSSRRILWSLLAGITALELVQFGLTSLNRAFEVADIVANVGGAWLLLTFVVRTRRKNPS